MKTREKILEKSLDLFSKYGYSGVTMEKVACEVGIKAPSIYKHFKSKEDIFNTILSCAVVRVDKNVKNITDYIAVKDGKECLDLERLAIDIFFYLLDDPYVSRVRKMISLEMYKNPEAMRFYVDKFIQNPMLMQEEVIEKLGLNQHGDIKVLSTIFYSPILLAVKLHDADATREEELLDLLKETYKKIELLIC